MHVSLYNTRSRSKEAFVPLDGKKVRMYCCGPTVYNFAHVGNLRTYLFEDILRRTLELAGYEVEHVMNITDVGHLSDDGDAGEDKMIAAARKKGLSVWDIAAMYTDAFFADTRRLNILRPGVVCKATDHIAEMIELVQRLEERGFTYQAAGNVYFDVSKFERYGDLALLDRQELKAGARIEVDSAKRNPADFVLWFTNSKFEHQAMIWDSPWGRGYPGWHIECSAMSRKYLGDQFDIHCGGVDHIPVHHTNEIAQTEAATGEHPWVKYWIHGEFLLRNKAKMSKSAGSFATVSTLVDLGYDPLDYRFFCLQAHYRTQLNYSDDALDAARAGLASLRERMGRLYSQAGSPAGITPLAVDHPLVAEFVAAISDDLNMPRAMAALNLCLKRDDTSPLERLQAVATMDRVLGLDLIERAALGSAKSADDFSPQEREAIEALLAQRQAARQARNWAESDRIRDELAARGVQIKDGPSGSEYRRI